MGYFKRKTIGETNPMLSSFDLMVSALNALLIEAFQLQQPDSNLRVFELKYEELRQFTRSPPRNTIYQEMKKYVEIYCKKSTVKTKSSIVCIYSFGKEV